MTVLVKGMEMPIVCNDCFALDDWGDYPCCRVTGEQRGYNFRIREQRMDKCPLVELPPHGRLIDADKLFDKIPPGDIEHDEKISRTGAIADVCTWVLSAPTVMEAEE